MIDDSIWRDANVVTVRQFLERFTLHDSALVALTVDQMEHLTLEIAFDLVWNKSVPSGFEKLLMRFERPYRVDWSSGAWMQPTIATVETVPVGAAQRSALLDDPRWDLAAFQNLGRLEKPHPAMDETLTRTDVIFVNWQHIEMLHGEALRTLIRHESGDIMDPWTHSGHPSSHLHADTP